MEVDERVNELLADQTLRAGVIAQPRWQPVSADHAAIDKGHHKERGSQHRGVCAPRQYPGHRHTLLCRQRLHDSRFANDLMGGIGHRGPRGATYHPRFAEPVDAEHLAAPAAANRRHLEIGMFAGLFSQPRAESADVEIEWRHAHRISSSRSDAIDRGIRCGP